MLRKTLSRNYFRFMWALIPVKPTAEGFNLHLENLSNCQVSSNPKHPKNLFPNFVTALFLCYSFPLWVIRKISQTVSEVRRLAGFQARKIKMERSQAHAAQQEASKRARGVESRGNFLNRGQFFLRADNAPDLRVWTLSRFLRVREEVGTSSSSNPLGFRRGPRVYHAKLKIALFYETYIMPAFPDKQ
jgi:hypothetical protein